MVAHRIDLSPHGQIDCDDLFGVTTQRALAALRSAQQHPRCMCQSANPSTSPRLVIRDLRNHLILALWPGEAARHAAHCRFAYPATKPTSSDSAARKWSLQIDEMVQLSETPAKPRASHGTRTNAHRARSTSRRTHAGLTEFLQVSWQRARLNEWQPGWQRDWSRVRYELQRMYVETRINGRPASECVCVVPAYRGADHANAIAWKTWIDGLQNTAARRLLIGECKVIELRDNTRQALIRPKQVFQAIYADEPLSDAGRVREAIAALDAGQHVVFAAAVEATRNGFLSAAERFALMPVDEHFRMCTTENPGTPSRSTSPSAPNV